MYRLMQISSMLLFPKPIVKNGEADLEDIQNLPISLRRWVRIPFNIGLALSIFMFVLWAWGKHAGWLE